MKYIEICKTYIFNVVYYMYNLDCIIYMFYTVKIIYTYSYLFIFKILVNKIK